MDILQTSDPLNTAPLICYYVYLMVKCFHNPSVRVEIEPMTLGLVAQCNRKQRKYRVTQTC